MRKIFQKTEKEWQKLKKVSKIIGEETDRLIIILKLSSGMDNLEREEREESFKFADAVTRMEGVPASDQLDMEIEKWIRGEASYLSLFFETLKKYNLISEDFYAYLAKKRKEGKHYHVAISHAVKKLVRVIFPWRSPANHIKADLS